MMPLSEQCEIMAAIVGVSEFETLAGITKDPRSIPNHIVKDGSTVPNRIIAVRLNDGTRKTIAEIRAEAEQHEKKAIQELQEKIMPVNEFKEIETPIKYKLGLSYASLPSENTLIIAPSGFGKTVYLKMLMQDHFEKYSLHLDDKFILQCQDRYNNKGIENTASNYKSIIFIDRCFMGLTEKFIESQNFAVYNSFWSDLADKNCRIVAVTSEDYMSLPIPTDLKNRLGRIFTKQIFFKAEEKK